MTLNFSAYPNADDATKARTEEFFKLSQDKNTPDATLLALVKQGIYPEALDSDHYTALIRAARYGKTETTKALVAAGAIIEPQSVSRTTPLILAALNGHTETVQALLAAGANVNAESMNHDTALLVAANKGHTETVQALLAAGANIEARSDLQDTALILAARYGRAETVKALLAAGADIEARCYNGRTALRWAVKNERTDIVKILLAAGANLGVKTSDGKSLLFLAEDDTMAALCDPNAWPASWRNFAANGTAPQSAKDVYRLLAETPLANPCAPVDYVDNIRKIFAHAKWSDKDQPADILSQMQCDGRVNAETADFILHNSFSERSHVQRLQPRDNGRLR